MTERKRSRKRVVPFRRPSQSTHRQRPGQTPLPSADNHAILGYLRWLVEQDHLGPEDPKRIAAALGPLVVRTPGIPGSIVEHVRNEMLIDDRGPVGLAEEELLYWRTQVAAGSPPLPDYDFDAVYRGFLCRAEEDPHRTVCFLNTSCERELPPYVPPIAGRAESFFLVTLRMIRLHHDEERRGPVPPKSPDPESALQVRFRWRTLWRAVMLRLRPGAWARLAQSAEEE